MFLAKRGSFDSPTNHGPIVIILTWFLTVASILWVFARVVTKRVVSRKVANEDYMIFIALAFSISQCVAVSVQTYNGLGRHIEALSSSQKVVFQQSGYASDLLFIGNLCFAKLSVVMLLLKITPVKLHRTIALALGGAIIVWALTSEFVAAFQCSIPEPWRVIDNKCINQNAFWTYFGILNILTDAALIFLPLAIIWKLQMATKSKFSIACCFGIRALVIASAIAQLVYLHRASGTADITYRHWPVVLCNQLVQNVGLVAACVPYIKPFFESLESGMMRTDDLRRRGVSGTYGYSSFSKSHSGARPAGPLAASSSSYKLSQLLSRATGGSVSAGGDVSTVKTVASAENRNDTVSFDRNVATVTAGARGLDLRPGLDAESQKSSSRIIKQTMTWEINR